MHLGRKVGPTSAICWRVGHLAFQLPLKDRFILRAMKSTPGRMPVCINVDFCCFHAVFIQTLIAVWIACKTEANYTVYSLCDL